jgi:pimeloyl-ACP methyl ester carboxylesterase
MPTTLSPSELLKRVGAPPQGRYAELNGIRMYYEEYGKGEPLLLIHGYFQTGGMWSAYFDTFSEHYRLIVPDLRGHGRTDNALDEFTHRQAAYDVFALLDRLNVRSVRGMGISTGGMTLIHMATQQPERVSSMVLIGSTHFFPAGCRTIMAEHTQEVLTAEVVEARSKQHRLGEKQIRDMQAHFNAMKDRYDDMNFTVPFLSSIKAETLIIHGDRDVFFPVYIPVEQYNAIPHAYLWIVPNGGHVPLDKISGLFEEKALEFLEGAWKDG